MEKEPITEEEGKQVGAGTAEMTEGGTTAEGKFRDREMSLHKLINVNKVCLLSLK